MVLPSISAPKIALAEDVIVAEWLDAVMDTQLER
jgi:hypothetical protein